MNLYICEKPSQGSDLGKVLGITKRGDGYLHDGGDRIITWAVGHLLELDMPQDYAPELKAWSLDTLPIAPTQWRYHVKKKTSKQFAVVQTLLSKANHVYIATDADREGEAIARTVLDRCKYQGTIERVLLSALDPTSIKSALSNIRPGNETLPLYYAAIARSRADWLIGMNASRLYTILAKKTGYKETLHVGRVLTPVVSLVCIRDLDIANFKPVPYYNLKVTVMVDNGAFTAAWQPAESLSDDQGRCINKAFAEQLAFHIKGQHAVISQADTKLVKEGAPLPFDSTSLQQYASKRWGYTAQEVLNGAQSLYETHKATTYPRVDNRYIPTSQIDYIGATLQGIVQSDPQYADLVAGADLARVSRAFNDEKTNAHHAIIPTPTRTDVSKMSPLEKNLYDAISRFYIAQFYPAAEAQRTNVTVTCGDHNFVASGNIPVKPGWKVIFGSEDEYSPKDEVGAQDDTSVQSKLPMIHEGEQALINSAELADKQTRPPAHFTEASLLAAMENVSRFVSDETLKSILKETAGLGTSATRPGILQGAVDKGYLLRKKKGLRASEKALALMAILPEALKSPGLTAAWEQELERIAAGEGSMDQFMEKITLWVSNLVTQVKANAESLLQQEGGITKAFESAQEPTYACQKCGGETRRLKGAHGFFWGCQAPDCRTTFPDNRGKPGLRDVPEDAPDCDECGKPMRVRSGKAPGKKRASKFWGCSDYPRCHGRKTYSRKKST